MENLRYVTKVVPLVKPNKVLNRKKGERRNKKKDNFNGYSSQAGHSISAKSYFTAAHFGIKYYAFLVKGRGLVCQ